MKKIGTKKSGSAARLIFREGESIDQGAFKALIRAAVNLNVSSA